MADAPDPAGISQRLAPIDGLRAVAVLGVIWWHAWIETGNPSFPISVSGRSLDLERLLVPLGTGFQLFFVLSGFCLYLSYQRLASLPFAEAYRRFLRRRWWRLTPAFYLVCFVTAVVLWTRSGHFSGVTIVAHALWIFNWVPGVESLNPVFWTLQVEWEFYVILPFLFGRRERRLQFGMLATLLVLCLAWRAWIHRGDDGIAAGSFLHLGAHFFPFVWGMLACEIWQKQPRWLTALKPLPTAAAALLVVFLGRGLESTEVFVLAGSLGWLPKAVSQPLMTFGYGLLILAALSGNNRSFAFLSSAPAQLIGRWSYGLYLWHWWPSFWIGRWLKTSLGASVTAHYLTMAVVLVVSLPLAGLTYRFFEAPFLNAARVRLKLATAQA